jgi:hypothetical protein
MKAKRPCISPIGVLLLACLAITVSATSCNGGSSSPNETKSSNQASLPTPTPRIITISAKAKQIEAVILRGDLVNEAELTGVSLEELRILRNVVFARHGMQYDRPGLGDYFYNCDWYKPDASRTPDNSATDWKAILTANDQKNKETVLRGEEIAKAQLTQTQPPASIPSPPSKAAPDKTAPSYGITNAQIIFRQTVISALQRCDDTKTQEDRISCRECLRSCVQIGDERNTDCERKWPQSQTADGNNLERCQEAVVLQVKMCLERCK